MSENFLYMLEFAVQELVVTQGNECAPPEYPFNAEFTFRTGVYVSIPEDDFGSIKDESEDKDLVCPPKRGSNIPNTNKNGQCCIFALEKPVDCNETLLIRVFKKRTEKCKFLIGANEHKMKEMFDNVMKKFIEANSDKKKDDKNASKKNGNDKKDDAKKSDNVKSAAKENGNDKKTGAEPPQKRLSGGQDDKPANAEKPAEDAKKPEEDAKKPAADAEKPAADTEKPAADAAKSAADAAKSAADAEKPAADAEKAAGGAEKPAADTDKPAANTDKPAADAKKSPEGDKPIETAKSKDEIPAKVTIDDKSKDEAKPSSAAKKEVTPPKKEIPVSEVKKMGMPLYNLEENVTGSMVVLIRLSCMGKCVTTSIPYPEKPQGAAGIKPVCSPGCRVPDKNVCGAKCPARTGLQQPCATIDKVCDSSSDEEDFWDKFCKKSAKKSSKNRRKFNSQYCDY